MVAARFTCPTAARDGSRLSASLPTLGIICVFDDSHPTGGEVLALCVSDLGFPDGSLFCVKQSSSSALWLMQYFPIEHFLWPCAVLLSLSWAGGATCGLTWGQA